MYKDEVLGSRCELAFDAGAFYAGTIRKVTMELNSDGTVTSKHYVVFDDGEKKWIDLSLEEADGELRWLKQASGSKRSAPTTSMDSPAKRPQQLPEADPDETAPAPTPERKVAQAVREPKHATPPRAPPKAAVAPPVAVPEPKQAAPIAEPTQAQRVAEPTQHVTGGMPDSIDAIIRYMDRIEPGKSYFRRQADSRDGCSKTRKKLRAHADKHPTDPAIAFWKQSGDWKPPDQGSLDAIVALLKTMIK